MVMRTTPSPVKVLPALVEITGLKERGIALVDALFIR